jgi:hypothetical protein
MKKYIDFTSVNACKHSYKFVRSQFSDLQKIIDHLPELLLQKKLLFHIMDYPYYTNTAQCLRDYSIAISNIEDKGILEVLYAHYTFIISGALKELQEMPGVDLNNPICIPKNLADPILVISNKLNVPPILTYYSHLILNWDHKNNKPIRRFSIRPKETNTEEIMHDFESGFMAVHIEIEKKSLPITTILKNVDDSFKANITNQNDIAAENLKMLSNELNEIIELLKTMYNQCSPSEYLQYIRIFLGDYRKIQFSNENIINLPGPSAAQSPTLLLFSSIFQANQSPNQNLSLVLKQAIQFIPADRREVIEDIAFQFHTNLPLIKNCQQSFRAYIELYYSYLHFLEEHFKLVFDYIIKPMQAIKNKSTASQKGTGTSNPNDLSLRVNLIRQDIRKLCDEYRIQHNDRHFMCG